MITELDGLPPGVGGFEVSGKIATSDYRDVVLPAVEQAAKDGMSGGAVWQELTVGVSPIHAWKRTALVTDIDWMSHAAELLGRMTSGQTKTFSLANKDQAIQWVNG